MCIKQLSFDMFDTLSTKLPFTVCEKNWHDVFLTNIYTHTLSFSSSLQPFPLPWGRTHQQHSLLGGCKEKVLSFIHTGSLSKWSLLKEFTLGQLVREATHATAQWIWCHINLAVRVCVCVCVCLHQHTNRQARRRWGHVRKGLDKSFRPGSRL